MTTPASQTDHAFTTFITMLLDTLSIMVPDKGDGSDASAIRRDIARMLFDALKPRDAVEAMLAARVVAAHHATLDSYARAADPDASDERAIRLRANAIAASRSLDAALRTLDGRQKRACEPAVETPAPSDGRRAVPVRQKADAPCTSDTPTALPDWQEATAHTSRRAAYRGSTVLTGARVPAGVTG